MPPQIYIFCIWIWFLTALYYTNAIKFSPLYLSISVVPFTIMLNMLYLVNIKPLAYRVAVMLFETGIATINTYKHFSIDKKPLISYKDIVGSILIFALYLIFLESINKTFYQVYFVDLLK
jgi:hypothetical protein